MAAHERPGKSDEWYTPKYIFDAMDTWFDLDVASPGPRMTPWIPAAGFITKNSLDKIWIGFVWMNPPFGKRNGIVPWLEKFIAHGDGIALTPDRTSAPWWQAFAPRMDALLFVSPKIKFIPGPGVRASSPGQGTCLGAIGEKGVAALRRSNLGVMVK